MPTRPSGPPMWSWTRSASRDSLTADQYRLYKLVWSRFLASQMANAVYDTVSIDTACAGHTFRSTHQSMRFPGFIAVYEEGRDDDGGGLGLSAARFERGRAGPGCEVWTRSSTSPSPRPGIPRRRWSRPWRRRAWAVPLPMLPPFPPLRTGTTWSSRTSAWCPQPLGEVVTGLMEERFRDIIDVELYRQHGEPVWTQIEAGKQNWKAPAGGLLSGF